LGAAGKDGVVGKPSTDLGAAGKERSHAVGVVELKHHGRGRGRAGVETSGNPTAGITARGITAWWMGGITGGAGDARGKRGRRGMGAVWLARVAGITAPGIAGGVACAGAGRSAPGIAGGVACEGGGLTRGRGHGWWWTPSLCSYGIVEIRTVTTVHDIK
jgi:hypothetical protein